MARVIIAGQPGRRAVGYLNPGLEPESVIDLFDS
jgi:hypothetical protein